MVFLDKLEPVIIIKRAQTLFDAIKHGDDTHQEWLKEAIEKHFKGEPVPEPRQGISK